ncbi:unnamed protein product [Angiostrongylus costaricensis]|uniref:MOSC_N domain-containing protein n=1 Tax=Angiostrongylus costaricensis TaxID=334426 RepID=A0A0R3PI56_ANGCS|nr:unnamed protein product [Angiostrongylus costaricensis]
MALSAGKLPRLTYVEGGLPELRVTIHGPGRHDKLRKPLASSFYSNPWVLRFSRSILGVKISSDDLEECLVFSAEHLQVHIERSDFFFVIV